MPRCSWILAAIVGFTALTVHAAEVNWMHDYDEALKKAKADKKLVMLDLYTDWCGWCKNLDKDVYTDQDVQARLTKSFVCVKINAEKDAKTEKLTKDLGVEGFPYIGFFDANGKKIAEIDGFVRAKKFCKIVDQVVNKAVR